MLSCSSQVDLDHKHRERDAGQTRTVGNFIQGSIFGKQLALEGNNPNLAPLGPYSEFSR